MTALTQSIKRKLSLLQLAEELGNVSKACRIMGYHRDTFYEVRRAFQVGGVAALVEEKRGPRHPHPNRVAPEVEEKILDYALSFPTHGPQRVSNELRLAGTEVGPSGVRGVWSRHGIETRYKRLMRLEHHAQGDTIVLSENQIRLLERHSVEFRCRHVEASRPGELLNQGHLLLGHAQGRRQGLRTGRRRCVLLARLRQGVHGEDAGHTAADLLYDRVLPFYEALGVKIGATSSRTTGASSAASRSAIPTSCCWRWKKSSIAPPRSAARAPTASSSA